MSKIQKIGQVRLNYSFYKGKDEYSDGNAAEMEMLEISKAGNWKDALETSKKWHILYHFSEIRKNLLEWYPFKKSGSLLEIGSGCGALSGLFSEKTYKVTAVELSERRSLINAYRNSECSNLEIIIGNFGDIIFDEKYDYITLIGVLEYSAFYVDDTDPYDTMLKKIKTLLKPDGKVLIAIENKMGLKYLNGAKEDHIGMSFAGIEDYRYSKIRTFSKPELEKLLKRNEFDEYSFYYPYPDYKLPETIYSNSFLPKPGEIRLWGTNYDTPRLALYNDAIMADQVCKDNMYTYLSNSFLIVTNDNNEIDLAHYTRTRKLEYQTKTQVRCQENIVVKSYLYQGDRQYDIFRTMIDYYEKLQDQYRNVEYLKPYMKEGQLIYDYIEGYSLETELFKYRHNPDVLVEEIKNIWERFFDSNEEYETEFKLTPEFIDMFGNVSVTVENKSFKYTNLDMLLHNLIVKEGKVYCIDYEWIVDFPVPKKFVLYRLGMDYWKKYGIYFSKIMSKDQFLLAIGIDEDDMMAYSKMYSRFGIFAYGEKVYINNYVKSKGTISLNLT